METEDKTLNESYARLECAGCKHSHYSGERRSTCDLLSAHVEIADSNNICQMYGSWCGRKTDIEHYLKWLLTEYYSNKLYDPAVTQVSYVTIDGTTYYIPLGEYLDISKKDEIKYTGYYKRINTRRAEQKWNLDGQVVNLNPPL